MSYTSPALEGAYIVNDAVVVAQARELGTGYESRDWAAAPLGTFATPMPIDTIPRSEWADRIEAMDQAKAWPKDHKILSGFPSLDQARTNFCWANAPIACCHYVRAASGKPHVPLSPASIAAPIKNYKNKGGWGSQALKYLINNGAVPQSLWPANEINRNLDNDTSRQARKDYRVTEWWELDEGNFDQLATCLFMGYPVAIGLNWWGHEVTAVQLLTKDGEYFTDIDNSWGGWGDNGHGILTEQKSTADDQVAARVLTPDRGEYA